MCKRKEKHERSAWYVLAFKKQNKLEIRLNYFQPVIRQQRTIGHYYYIVYYFQIMTFIVGEVQAEKRRERGKGGKRQEMGKRGANLPGRLVHRLAKWPWEFNMHVSF